MGEVIFEVFFETFSKPLHLFGMRRGILQPQTKIFPHLFYRDIDVFAKKNNSLTLKKKIKGNMAICERFLSKNFVPSPIPNGRGQFLSLFQKLLQKITPA